MKHNVLSIVAGLGLGLALAFLLVGLPMLVSAQGSIGSTFTYQGRLLKSGFYVDSITCDFQFGLYDALSGGAQVGTTQTVPGVSVRGGYFSVELNGGNEFGPDAFTGDERYLQIAVRCGTETTYTTMNERVPLHPAPYALYARNAARVTSVAWSDVISKPAGFADDVDDVVTYTNGFGLDLQVFTYTQGMAVSEYGLFSLVTGTVLNAVSDTWQLRVTGSCDAPDAIQVIHADGTVLCGTTSPTYSAGVGLLDLSLTGNQFRIDDNVVQRLATDPCPGGQAIRKINRNGSRECENVPPGDITAVNASSGLTATDSGGPVVDLEVADYGIASSMLADGAVTTDKIADSAVGTDQLDSGAVNSDHLYSGTDDGRKIQAQDLNTTVCGDGRVMVRNGSTSSFPYWDCGTNGGYSFDNVGPGIALNGTILSLNVGEGIGVAGDESLFVNFAGTGVNEAARGDHDHDPTYVRKDQSVSGRDISGSYDDGFTVVKLRDNAVAADYPADGQVLRWVASGAGQWAPQAYDFPVNFQDKIHIYVSDRASNSMGQIDQSCGSGEVVLGGGCECDDNSKIQDSYPSSSDTWWCDCHKDDDVTTNKAWVLCIKNTYP